MALPTLTPEQRAQALEKAAASRRARAALREELKTGKATFAEVLGRGPRPCCAQILVPDDSGEARLTQGAGTV